MCLFCTYSFFIIHLCTYLIHINKINVVMKDIEIPKQETKTKRLMVPVTSSEHEKVMKYCSEKKVNLTDLIRFALKNTYELL